MSNEGTPYFMLTQPTATAPSVYQGGTVGFRGDVVALNGFTQSLTLRVAIGQIDGPFVQTFDLPPVNPPFPSAYQASVSIPQSFKAGNYEVLFWAQTSDNTRLSAATAIPLAVFSTATIPTVNEWGMLILTLLLIGTALGISSGAIRRSRT